MKPQFVIRLLATFQSLPRISAQKLIPMALVAVLCALTGYNQHRYQPAQWRAADRDSTTLPNSNRNAEADLANQMGSTLPWRGMNSGTTMPWRGTTLPGRGTTMPWRGTTLPGRGTTLPYSNWTTLPNRGWSNGSPLPDRGRAIQYRSQTTLPNSRIQESNWSTLRNPGSTLPSRRSDGFANPLRGSRD